MAEEESPCSGPGCGAMFAFEVIGSELKLTVLHSLLTGPKRFNELRVATGICQSSLAKTLKELEEVGIAERKVHLDRPVARSEEHTSELQSQSNLVCRLLL